MRDERDETLVDERLTKALCSTHEQVERKGHATVQAMWCRVKSDRAERHGSCAEGRERVVRAADSTADPVFCERVRRTHQAHKGSEGDRVTPQEDFGQQRTHAALAPPLGRLWQQQTHECRHGFDRVPDKEAAQPVVDSDVEPVIFLI